jgi:endonuclease III
MPGPETMTKTKETNKEKIKKIIPLLKKMHPQGTVIYHSNPLELLVCHHHSARVTDKRFTR